MRRSRPWSEAVPCLVAVMTRSNDIVAVLAAVLLSDQVLSRGLKQGSLAERQPMDGRELRPVQ